jgi:hypothetical protein
LNNKRDSRALWEILTQPKIVIPNPPLAGEESIYLSEYSREEFTVYKKIVFGYLTVLLLLSSCQKQVADGRKGIDNFPPQMVGTWQGPPGILDAPNWQITFEKDGTISKMYHRIFGPVIVQDGGVYREGPQPGTYMVIALGPVETEYDSVSKMIKAKIAIDDYEMKLPTGSLEGRMIDTLVGKASEDGQTWQAEWRNYGWLKGAQEPNIAFIDKNPDEIITFQKLHLSDPNTKGQ